jgi:hypothetical protein
MPGLALPVNSENGKKAPPRLGKAPLRVAIKANNKTKIPPCLGIPTISQPPECEQKPLRTNTDWPDFYNLRSTTTPDPESNSSGQTDKGIVAIISYDTGEPQHS